MNKRAETPFTLIFVVFVFLLIWGAFLGGFINLGMGIAIDGGNLTGFAAFFYANFNLMIGFVLLLFLLGYAYYVSSG